MDHDDEITVYASPPLLSQKEKNKSDSGKICGAYSEYFPPGCLLPPGHEGNHQG